MTKYLFIGLSFMWMTVFYQNCSPNAMAKSQHLSERK